MAGKVTPELRIQWIKLGTWILFTWPPKSNAKRMTKICFETGWWLSFIVLVHFISLQVGTAWLHRTNPMILIEMFGGFICIVKAGLLMIIAKVHYRPFQNAIEKMEIFIRDADFNEREILMNYVKQMTTPQLGWTVVSLFTILGFILSPFVNGQPLPVRVVYPFSVDKHPTYDIVFLIQSIISFQCGASIFFSCQLSILIWHQTIQLDILADNMRNVDSNEKLGECISAHQDLLQDIDNLIKIIRPAISTIVTVTTLGILCWGMPIVGNASILIKLLCVLICVAYSNELLLFAWTAERLTTAYEEVGWALYSSPWIQTSKEFKRSALFVMHRCQKPPVIAIGGLMPELSMSYYASYMAASYSYFTAVNAALKQSENNP